MVCDVLSMICINCNNILQQCICTLSPFIVTYSDYVLIGEIAGNKHPYYYYYYYLNI